MVVGRDVVVELGGTVVVDDEEEEDDVVVLAASVVAADSERGSSEDLEQEESVSRVTRAVAPSRALRVPRAGPMETPTTWARAARPRYR